MLLANTIFAQELVKVDESANAVFYVDKTSIKKEKGFTRFKAHISAKAFTSTTDFATDCKNYVVLFERFETADEILTREKRKLEPSAVQDGTPIASAVNYVCYNTLKKDKPVGTLPQAE